MNRSRDVRVAARWAAAAGLAWSASQARCGGVSAVEERWFRRINALDDRASAPIWVVMQSGSLGAVFAGGALVRRRGRRARAAVIVLGGTLLWAGVKVLKVPIGRGRPASLLREVRIRGAEASGLGYPSGHAAVSTVLALTVPDTGAGRSVAAVVAAVTGGARVYVGAHLPLDVVGGAALGVLAADVIDGVGSLRRWREPRR